jgi:hypothetical protein
VPSAKRKIIENTVIPITHFFSDILTSLCILNKCP